MSTDSTSPVPSQAGRTWLITGATNGLGRELALSAARAGARVIVPARNAERAAAVVAQLRELGADAEARVLDLADLASVRACAATVDEPVDVLINNAGAAPQRRATTKDGFELTIGTNFLGPFALTNLLADRLRGRVVIVGSIAHRMGRVDVLDPHFRHRPWNFGIAYAQSKLADMLWARALQPRVAPRGLDVQLAHPGWAYSNLQNGSGRDVVDRVVTAITRRLAQPTAAGAEPILRAAVDDLPPLTYMGPSGFGHVRGSADVDTPRPIALDDDAAEAVWALGVRETGTDL